MTSIKYNHYKTNESKDDLNFDADLVSILIMK